MGFHRGTGGNGVAIVKGGEDVDVAPAGGVASAGHALRADDPFLEETADGAEELSENRVLAGFGDLEVKLEVELDEVGNGQLQTLGHRAFEFLESGDVGGRAALRAEGGEFAFEDDAGFR